MNVKHDSYDEEPVIHKRYYKRRAKVKMTYAVDKYDVNKRRYVFFGFITAKNKKFARQKLESIGDRNGIKLRVYGVGFLSCREKWGGES